MVQMRCTIDRGLKSWDFGMGWDAMGVRVTIIADTCGTTSDIEEGDWSVCTNLHQLVDESLTDVNSCIPISPQFSFSIAQLSNAKSPKASQILKSMAEVIRRLRSSLA